TTYHQAISGTSTAVTIDDTRLVAAASANGVVTGAGHNYAKTFGKYTATSGINISTASNFSVESTKNAGLTFQVGANEGDSMVIHIDKMDANYLGVESASVATRSAASAAIRVVDKAINQVSSQRAYLGAIQNRLDHKIANLTTSAENLTSAESLIRDVDMAKEMTNFTNANILQQAATAMLAQANALPQNVLSLIGG
ncbi:MAG: flagellin, partial [Clostridiales bacterium]|nr:flagellin [Clostridiales bacterium]